MLTDEEITQALALCEMPTNETDNGNPAFIEAWKRYQAQGYQYGADALENVGFGWDIAMEVVAPMLKGLATELREARAELNARAIEALDSARRYAQRAAWQWRYRHPYVREAGSEEAFEPHPWVIDAINAAQQVALRERDDARAGVSDGTSGLRAELMDVTEYWHRAAKERDTALARAEAAEEELANVQAVAAAAACGRVDSLAETWRNVEHNTAERIAAFIEAEAEDRREEGFSYRAVSELAAEVRAGAWRTEGK